MVEYNRLMEDDTDPVATEELRLEVNELRAEIKVIKEANGLT